MATSYPHRSTALLSAPRHGVITDADLISLGGTPGQIRRWIHKGHYRRVLPGVVAIGGAPRTWKQQASAAASWGGAGCAISGPSAFRVRGFDGFSRSMIELSITSKKDRRAVPFKVHRVDRHLLSEIETVDGIPITSVNRTIVDLAAVNHLRTERSLHEGLRRNLITEGSFFIFVEDESMRGRRGIARARSIALALTGTEHLTATDVEQKLAADIWRSDLPKPELQFPIMLSTEKNYFDFAYPAAMLAIEVDGYAWHGGRKSFERDRERDVESGLLGWTVLRFTWAQVMFKPDYVLGAIRLHLEKRGLLSTV